MTVLQRTCRQENFPRQENLPEKKETRLSSACRNRRRRGDSVPSYRRLKTLKVFVIKIFVLHGPQRPTMPFSLMHISITATSSKQRSCRRRSAFASLSSASLTGCGTSSPREETYPMSPWGWRPEDTPWGCSEGRRVGKQSGRERKEELQRSAAERR